MKKILLAALILALAAASTADAQSQPWERVHGYVQNVRGSQVTVQTNDGRILTVDASQVSDAIRQSLRPGEGVELVGFPGAQPNQFTARYIQKEASDVRRGGVIHGQTTGDAQQVIPVIPELLASEEFRRAGINVRDPDTAATIARRLYQSFFGRMPKPEEVQMWQNRLVRTGDLRSTLEAFMTSEEYLARGKGVEQGVIDLYQAVLGRTPSEAEINTWKQRLARR